ncbi:MAG: class B sortase, partial [Anaerovoracaceae bacterium]
MKIIRRIVFVIALIVFLGSAGYLLQHYLKGEAEQKDFESLKVSEGHDVAALHEENPDIAGWVQIEGTIIDYPVMQTVDEPEYYLRRNFKKEDSLAGTPFMDANSDMRIPSKNLMIYGHNMKNGTMFHSLLEYEEKEYFDAHPTVRFDTLDGPGEYEIIAAGYTEIYPEDVDVFKYYNYVNITEPSDFREYVQGVKALSAY